MSSFLQFAGGIGAVAIVAMLSFMAPEIVMAFRRPEPHGGVEMKQIHFAAAAASGLVIVFVLAMGMVFFAESDSQATAAKAVFDACKVIIPPIGSLIFGYYFGKAK